MQDRFGGSHTTDNQAAIAAFESAVFAIAAHRPIGTSLKDALTADPGLIAGHALHGLANVILARAETVEAAKSILATARSALATRAPGTMSERALVDALALAVAGELKAAAGRLDQHLEDRPTDFLAVKLSHAFRFMSGQNAEMIALTRHILPCWSAADGGYGFVLGCHAFGLEETGHYGAAERYGREAYETEPADAWGLHAVSHVMEMSHRIEEGADLLEGARENWTRCNNFGFHIAWHLALFRLEQGRADAVLDLYDRDIRPVQTDDFRDMANAASMLWRLELDGVPVGDRWAALREVASQRRRDMSYVFGTLHYLLALAGSGDKSGVADLMASLAAEAHGANGDQSQVAATIGLPMAETITALASGRKSTADLVSLAERLGGIGGSHAQRDVFMRTLLVAAARHGTASEVLSIAKVRHAVRSADRFITQLERRIGEQARPVADHPQILLAS